jgi:hypothetical protein
MEVRPLGRDGPWIALAALVLAALLGLRFDAPWIYIHDDNGAVTQAIAAAHLRAGLSQTRGQDFFLRRRDGALVPILHHPPLQPLLTAGCYRLTGRSDPVATRAVPAAFHVLGLLGLAVLARALFPQAPLVRRIALFLYAVVPMSSFFGKMPFNEPVGLSAIVWGVALYVRHRARPSNPRLVAAMMVWAFAIFASWPAVPILGCILALTAREAWISRSGEPASRGAVLLLAGTVVGATLLVLGQLAWAAGGRLDPLFKAGGHWGAALLHPREALHQLGAVIDFHRRYFANLPFLLLLVWVAQRLARMRRGEALPFADRLLLGGIAGCTVWALVFLRQVALHAYGQFWFLPFEALAVADLSVGIGRRLAGRPQLRTALAALAIAITLISTVAVLHFRYTRVHGYAVRTAAWLANEYETAPRR